MLPGDVCVSNEGVLSCHLSIVHSCCLVMFVFQMKKIKKGGSKAFNSLMGPVQLKLDRRADPLLVAEIIQDILKKLPN